MPVGGVSSYPLGMRLITVVALILVTIGIVALAYQGITYTTSERVVDLGPLKVEAKREKTLPLPPILGAAAVIGGVILIAVSSRR
jgi:hypothetical protein